MEGVLENRARLTSRIEAACRAAGRAPSEVRLVAVTKTVRSEVARALCAAGSSDLGENRLPAFEEKVRSLEEAGLRPRWHFIGHIQRNKSRGVLRLAHEIHSVDSSRLLEALERVAREEDRRPGLYLQVNVAGEAAKGGFAPRDVPAVVEAAHGRAALPLLGLMTMAPLVPEADRRSAARATFAGLRELAEELPGECFVGGRPALSMGMSGDLEEAVLEGSHLLRIGSALFEGLAEDHLVSRGGAR